MANVKWIVAAVLVVVSAPAQGIPVRDFSSLVQAASQFNPAEQTCLAVEPGVLEITFPAAVPVMSDLCIDFTGVTLMSDGGQHRAFTVTGGTLTLYGGNFQGFRGDNGGVLDFGPGTLGEIVGTRFTDNRVSGLGGAISWHGSKLTLDNVLMSGNQAGVFGCDLNIDTPMTMAPSVFVRDSHFFGSGCTTVRVEAPLGHVLLTHDLFQAGSGGANLVDATGAVDLLGDGMDTAEVFGSGKLACRDFGSGAFRSLGYNWTEDTTCPPNGPGDMTGRITFGPLVGTLPSWPAGSPAIDRGLGQLTTIAGVPTLPCGPSDARGLGRPQDGNGDGIFECDVGAYEAQGGPDIGPAQGATYFDVSRNGEGSVVELFGDGSAIVATFTYRPDQRGLAWFLGVGRRVGNSIVVGKMLRPRGGAFGAAFNAANIRNPVVGAASMVFPTCDAGARPGKFMFRANRSGGFQDLMVNATRITAVVPCAGSAHGQVYRSGSYYDPTRSGEGIFFELLTDGRVTLIWYTFDPQGNQLWLVSSGQVQVQGNRYTIEMLYPAQATRFGSNFNPAEIVLQPWGNVVLDFTGCNTAQFSYNSTVPGFGSGSFNYVRLTQPNGTSCPPSP